MTLKHIPDSPGGIAGQPPAAPTRGRELPSVTFTQREQWRHSQ